VQIVFVWAFDVPDVALVTIATPVTLNALGPAVKDGLILALVIGATQREPDRLALCEGATCDYAKWSSLK